MSATSSEPAAIEIKGRMLTVTLLRIHSASVETVLDELQQRVSRAGALLRELPLVLELCASVPLAELVALLREQGFAPMAVTGAHPALAEAARAAGLSVIAALGGGRRDRPEPGAAETVATPVSTAPPAAPAPNAAKIVTEPVRSGQRIYARSGDLVVLAQVSAGAEVIADGSIHVYAPLRGRALAGAQGNTGARVFCQQFAAELVAVAGCYQLIEDLPAERQQRLLGKAAQVWLQDEQLRIEALHAS